MMFQQGTEQVHQQHKKTKERQEKNIYLKGHICCKTQTQNPKKLQPFARKIRLVHAIICYVRPLKPRSIKAINNNDNKRRYILNEKWVSRGRTQNIYCNIPHILKTYTNSFENQIPACPSCIEINVADDCKCCCFFERKSNIALRLRV